MNNIEKLVEIAEFLGLRGIISELEMIDLRSKLDNANLILPLVGEFSSGKTTLINALTDSKKLETATKPTTSTIYEVHFGCDSCHAKVVMEDGVIHDVNDLAEFKNDILSDAKVVTVFDTSKRVPATTILVDTPGLSSPEQKHKQTLVSFLPKADGIMLVIDINQQITKSLTDFIETMKLSRRPIYLILTKSDTKSAGDIESAKKYISENCQIPLKQVAVVSSATDSVDELYVLLDNIQKDKKEILKQVDGQRVKDIVKYMTEYIEEVMVASDSNEGIEEAIRKCQYELDKITRNIDKLVDSMSEDIEEHERVVVRKFEDIIFSKLNNIITSKSSNYDAEAISMINNTATLLMNDYKTGIRSILRKNSQCQKGTENEVSLASLENLDMDAMQIQGLSYNLDLNTMGHEYDGWIKVGVIATAAVATAAAISTTGGAPALKNVATLDNVIDIADTVSDVGSIISNQKTVSKIEKVTSFVSDVSQKYNSINESNQQMGSQVGSEKGMVDSLIGLVTDNVISKPQRVRAIRNYIDGSLVPDFKSGLQTVTHSLIDSIRCGLHTEASVVIGQKTENLNQLKMEMREKKELFDKRMEQLREFKTVLLAI